MKPGDSFKYKCVNQVITLIRILDKQFGKTLPERLYDWEYDDGIKFTNRQQDVDRWIKFNEIEKIEDLGL